MYTIIDGIEYNTENATFLAKLETEDMLYQTKSGTLLLVGSGLLSFFFYEFFQQGDCTNDGYIFITIPHELNTAGFEAKRKTAETLWFRRFTWWR